MNISILSSWLLQKELEVNRLTNGTFKWGSIDTIKYFQKNLKEFVNMDETQFINWIEDFKESRISPTFCKDGYSGGQIVIANYLKEKTLEY